MNGRGVRVVGLFGKFGRAGQEIEPAAPLAQESAPLINAAKPETNDQDHAVKPKRRRTGRIKAYSVRVREDFKSEVLRLLSELQLERLENSVDTRKVTEGELMEMMLETFKAARRTSQVDVSAVPLSSEVWQGVHEIARTRHMTPASVIEELVVQKVAELGLIPLKHE